MLSKISGAAFESENNVILIESHSENDPIRSRGLSVTSILLGSAVLVWVAFEVIRRSEATFTAKMCLPFAIGVALIAFGAFALTKWRYVVCWGGIALVGQAAALQMVDAGRLIHFQHYRPIPELVDQYGIASSFLVLQTVCVGLGLWPRIGAIRNWLRRFAPWQLILIFLVLSFSGAAVTPDPSTYLTSLGVGTFVQLVSIANIVLLAWSVPISVLDRTQDWVNRLLDGSQTRQNKPGLDRFSIIAGLGIVLLTAALSYFVYEAHPHVPDESQYLFQAKYMAAGQLTTNAPLVPEAFSMYMVPFQESRWFGLFPPAWPAMLAVGTLVGASWLVNPLLSGLCVLLAYLFFQEVYSRRFARIAILLLCCSPWFIFMGMSFMSHVATLVFSLAAAFLTMRGCRTKSKAAVLSAGLCVGLTGLIRPLDAAIVGLLLVIWCLFNNSTWKARVWTCGILTFAMTLTSALALPYNILVTGNAGISPSDAYYNKYVGPKVMALGFGPERGMHWGLDAFPGHSPLEAIVNASLNIFLLNTELFGWGIGSLLLLTLVGVAGSISKRDLWAVVVIGFVIGAYSLFWYHGGPDFGARYWFLTIIPIIALTIRGGEWISRSLSKYDNNLPSARVVVAIGVMCLLSLLTYVPWRASDKYYRYLGTHPGIQQLATELNFGRSLVILRGAEHPDYQSAWINNPVNFDGGVPIYALDRNPEIYDQLLINYADRPIWIVNGPTLTNGDYSIVRGPVDALELLNELKR